MHFIEIFTLNKRQYHHQNIPIFAIKTTYSVDQMAKLPYKIQWKSIRMDSFWDAVYGSMFLLNVDF